MTQIKIETLFYFVFERKIIPTAVGEDRRKKNNQPRKTNLKNLSMFIRLIASSYKMKYTYY